MKGVVTMQSSGYSAVDDVILDLRDFSNFGIEEDGSVPDDNQLRRVCVPETTISIDGNRLADIKRAVKACRENGDVNGIQSYILALELLNSA